MPLLLTAVLCWTHRLPAQGEDRGAVSQRHGEGTGAGTGILEVTDFLPDNYVTDGSVSYQRQLQQALDTAAASRQALRFRPMVYLLDDPKGLELRSGATLYLYGAVFRLAGNMDQDGQALLGRDVTDVVLLGGEIAGSRDQWPDSVNVAGVRITGRSARIRIRDMYLHDLSSNGVGVFGPGPDAPIKDVWVSGTIIRRCCNKYVDYLLPGTGPARGSQRTDQGGIAMYHVENFVVQGCALEDSASDGTHFYRCSRGRFTGNVVSGSTMGGYFVESSQYILAADNLILDNGSRGVTIEAGSRYCTLQGNVIQGSGREGLWAPDSIGLVVTGNIFRHNGQKDDAEKDGEIMINESTYDPPGTPQAEQYRIADNVFYTTAKQDAAIRVLPKASDILIENNSFFGPVRTIVVDTASPHVRRIVVRNNIGATVTEPEH